MILVFVYTISFCVDVRSFRSTPISKRWNGTKVWASSKSELELIGVEVQNLKAWLYFHYYHIFNYINATMIVIMYIVNNLKFWRWDEIK